MPDLSSGEFKMDTSIKDIKYLIKDASWMDERGLPREEVGELEGQFKFGIRGERRSEWLSHIMLKLEKLIMLCTLEILLLYNLFYILLTYTGIIILFRLNQMTFLSFCVSSTEPIAHHALWTPNPYLYLDTNS